MDNEGQKGAKPEGAEVNSPDDSQTEVVSALTERLKNVEGQLNSLRSDKDKGTAKTNRRLGDFEKKQEELATMQEYLTEYGSPEKAARAMALDALLLVPDQPQGEQQSIQQPDGTVAGAEANQTDADNLVPLLGVDEKDPTFVTLVGTGMTPNEAAVQIATKRNSSQEVTDPNQASGIAGTGAGGAAEGSQQSVLEQQYSERLGNIKQGDWKSVARLKDEFRGKGLEKY